MTPEDLSNLTIQQLPVSELREYENNPRNNDAAVRPVAESIKRFGFKQPLVVDKDKVIIVGHTRLRAAKELQLETVPCVVAEMSEDEARAYRILDNKLNEKAEWETDLLRGEIERLGDFNFGDFDVDFSDVNDTPVSVAESLVPETPVTPQSQHGDLWLLGKHRLLCGDSADAAIFDADLLLTDPPYGIGRNKGFGGSGGFGGFGAPIPRRSYSDNWDAERPSAETMQRILKETSLIFGGNFFADILPVSTHWIVWDKLNTMPTFGDCELVWTNISRTSVKKITFEYNGLIGKEENRQHPTQKPVGLIVNLLNDYSKAGDVVLDPFLGSGTTLIAAQRTDRTCRGLEIEPKYCDVICQRFYNETKIVPVTEQGKLFIPKQVEGYAA